MLLETEASSLRKAELTEEAEKVENQYKALLEDHLTSEKSLRARRFKVETQLASWLTKYDTDVGERNAELEELTKKLVTWRISFKFIVEFIVLLICLKLKQFVMESILW